MAAKKETFEKILEKLEGVVHDLEEGGLPLEKALARFEEGVRLTREGAKRLEQVERRIEEVLGDGATAALDLDDEDS